MDDESDGVTMRQITEYRVCEGPALGPDDIVDPRDINIDALRRRLAAAEFENAALRSKLGMPARGGIHPASTLAGGNVDHPPRTRDEGRIHVTDQY